MKYEVIKLVFSVLPCHQCIKSLTDGHFVSRDLFIYCLNQMGMMSEMAIRKG